MAATAVIIAAVLLLLLLTTAAAARPLLLPQGRLPHHRHAVDRLQCFVVALRNMVIVDAATIASLIVLTGKLAGSCRCRSSQGGMIVVSYSGC